MRRFDRIILIILDGVGVGELPDAGDFKDTGSDTLGNIIKRRGQLNLPNLCSLGLGRIVPGLQCGSAEVVGAYGKCNEQSSGKDSTSGHWEIMSNVPKYPFPVFPDGFPNELITRFEYEIGRKVLGNMVASGTDIVECLGEKAFEDKAVIAYTSADSVFQIAAHIRAVPLEELYQICEIARGMLTGKLGVARVIARPFDGIVGEYFRTPDRRDFSIEPQGNTVLDELIDNGLSVFGVGKVDDLFAGRGFTACEHIADNYEGILKIKQYLERDFDGLLFANLNDTDTKYGHRNDVEGYAKSLERFDAELPEILRVLGERDLLIITSDHGNDPTTPSTDHSREYTPLLVWHNSLLRAVNLGTRNSFSDIGKTIASNFEILTDFNGLSFINEIL